MSTLKVNSIEPHSGRATTITAAGSVLGSLLVESHITASGDISASGAISASAIYTTTLVATSITSSFVTSSQSVIIHNYTSSGDSIFGDAATDTHLFNGSISASSDISASGTVYGYTGSFNHISGSGNVEVAGSTKLYGDSVVIAPAKLYFGNKNALTNASGLHVYSDGVAPGEDQKIVCKTNDLKIMQQDHGKSIIFSTEDATGTAEEALTLTGGDVTASGDISASGYVTSSGVLVDGESRFKGDITIEKLNKLYFTDSSGLHIYSEGTATDENQIILAKTNNLRILNQAHGKDILFGTENAAGTAKSPLTLKGEGQAIFGGPVTASSDVSASGTISVYNLEVGTLGVALSGHITASGQISASGNVYGDHFFTKKNLRFVDQEGINGLTFGNTTSLTKIESKTDEFLWLNNDTHVTGAVTASSDISGSGTISGHSYITDTQTVAAAGDAIGNATQIADTAGIVFCTTDDAAKGVKLPAVSALAIGTTLTVHNTSGANLEVYPTANDRIFPLTDNNPATVPANTTMVVTAFSADGYVGYFTTIIS